MLRHFRFAVLAALLVNVVEAQAPKGVTATRIYSGADGETHAEEINLSQMGAAQPDLLRPTSVRFATRGPDTWDDWHTAPGRQYLITLKGHVEIEIGGGKIVQANEGSILLIEDTTGKGHRAHVTKESEWHVMFIPLPPTR